MAEHRKHRWVFLHNGRVKRFRNRQTRHDCAKRRRGRPGVGYGMCYLGNKARAVRRALNVQVRRVGRDWAALEEFTLEAPAPGKW